MRKYITNISILIIFITFTSCEENFSPKGEFKRQYVLNCIIKSDTTFQTAKVTQNYEEGEFSSKNEDPFIEGVFLRIWQNGKVYVFKDTSVTREDTSRYKTPLKYYYLDNFKPELEEEIRIEAVLPNGRILSAATVVPMRIYEGPDRPKFIPPDNEVKKIIISWMKKKSDNIKLQNSELFYDPKMRIIYKKDGEKRSELVPLSYEEENGDSVPVYPRPLRLKYIELDMDVINRKMSEISEGDPEKSSYEMLYFKIDVLIYDPDLSSYFSSIAELDDDFSVNVSRMDLSNVDGGLGLFGSYYHKEFYIKFKKVYVEGFGYQNAQSKLFP